MLEKIISLFILSPREAGIEGGTFEEIVEGMKQGSVDDSGIREFAQTISSLERKYGHKINVELDPKNKQNKLALKENSL